MSPYHIIYNKQRQPNTTHADRLKSEGRDYTAHIAAYIVFNDMNKQKKQKEEKRREDNGQYHPQQQSMMRTKFLHQQQCTLIIIKVNGTKIYMWMWMCGALHFILWFRWTRQKFYIWQKFSIDISQKHLEKKKWFVAWEVNAMWFGRVWARPFFSLCAVAGCGLALDRYILLAFFFFIYIFSVGSTVGVYYRLCVNPKH